MNSVSLPHVSVVIPAYNSAKFLVQALGKCILARPIQDYEVIVIDDGSTDNTQAILEPYLPRINYTYQDNQGVASSKKQRD